MIASSPILVRVTADLLGFRNREAIRIMQKQAQALQAIQFGQLEGAIKETQGQAQGGGQEGSQIAQGIVAQQTPPDQEEIRNQLSNPLTQVQ